MTTTLAKKLKELEIENASMNAFNRTTLTGFYGFMILSFGLILVIVVVMWGSDILSKQERE